MKNGVSWEDDGYCYICGKRNPEGFKIDFQLDETGIEASFTAEKRHQGYRDVLHGGILTMMMDEVMIMLPYRRFGEVYVTGQLEVKLKKPVAIGERVTVRAEFDGGAEPGRRLYHMKARAVLVDGTEVASGSGKCVRVAAP